MTGSQSPNSPCLRAFPLFLSLCLFFSKQPLHESSFHIPKSRYNTIDSYLVSSEYNDVEILYDPKVFQILKDGGKRRMGMKDGEQSGGREEI